jgi:hypothetical protein
MVSHSLIDSSSSAALRLTTSADAEIFSRELKNIKHDTYFPQGLEKSNPHENYLYPHVGEQLAELAATRGG